MDFFYQLWFFRVKLDCRKLLQEESLVNLLWLYHAAQWRSPSLFFHLSAQIVVLWKKKLIEIKSITISLISIFKRHTNITTSISEW